MGASPTVFLGHSSHRRGSWLPNRSLTPLEVSSSSVKTGVGEQTDFSICKVVRLCRCIRVPHLERSCVRCSLIIALLIPGFCVIFSFLRKVICESKCSSNMLVLELRFLVDGHRCRQREAELCGVTPFVQSFSASISAVSPARTHTVARGECRNLWAACQDEWSSCVTLWAFINELRLQP